MEPVIDIKNLRVSFNERPALRGVDFTASVGSITVIIGPSGSGKTTLLRAINRLNELIPNCRTTGSVRFKHGGRWLDVLRDMRDVSVLRRRAAMVFQSPNVLPVSIERNFSLPLRLTLELSRPVRYGRGARPTPSPERATTRRCRQWGWRSFGKPTASQSVPCS